MKAGACPLWTSTATTRPTKTKAAISRSHVCRRWREVNDWWLLPGVDDGSSIFDLRLCRRLWRGVRRRGLVRFGQSAKRQDEKRVKRGHVSRSCDNLKKRERIDYKQRFNQIVLSFKVCMYNIKGLSNGIPLVSGCIVLYYSIRYI
jgi:hypothetical protein